MSEGKEATGRTRWFQFGLRELFLLLTAVGVILALEFGRDVRRKTSGRKLRDAVQVGDRVKVYGTGIDSVGRQLEMARGKITEFGEDFIVVDNDNLIPIANICRIERIPSPPPAQAGAPGMGGGMPGGGGAPGGGPGGGFPGGAGLGGGAPGGGANPGGGRPGSAIPIGLGDGKSALGSSKNKGSASKSPSNK